MKKRLASIALALTLCIGMMPTAAWAEDDGISVQNIQGIAEKETMFSADWIVGTNNDGSVKRNRGKLLMTVLSQQIKLYGTRMLIISLKVM